MDQVKKHFEKEAEEFDEIIKKYVPYYEDMIEALILAIPFNKLKSFDVMDLGCGTATISKKIIENFPNAKITCLEQAENMIKMAKIKLQKYDEVRYILKDFNNLEFNKKYDLVVSSLALHHLKTDEDKKRIYKKIYDNLLDNGIFYIADAILGPNEHLHNLYISKWKEFMLRYVSTEEIEEKVMPMYDEEDRPAKLIDQTNWLVEIGFRDVDVIWKNYKFAVYGGIK